MTTPSTDRVQRICDLVETILTEIATEHDSPYAAASVMAKFCMDLTVQITRISHERLAAFIQAKHQPGD